MTPPRDGSIDFGNAAHLRFSLVWSRNDRQTAADATRGCLSVHVGEQLVWGVQDGDQVVGFEWTWVELLEHLAVVWPYLEHEQADPVGLDEPPALLRNAAEEQWADMPAKERDRKEEELLGFLETHDLSRGLHGAWPAPLWLLREGSDMRIWCLDASLRAPLVDVLNVLSELGDAICARVESLEDTRSTQVRDKWAGRRAMKVADFIELSTGLDRETIDLVAAQCSLGEDWETDNGVLTDNEFLAVARMASTKVGAADLATMLNSVRTLPHVWTGLIDKLGEEARRETLERDSSRPYEQGYAAATWLRKKRQVPANETVDVEALLLEWKIELVQVKLTSRAIDAISCWGLRHGPGIILNRSGLHSRFAARRATLAHELAHLLLDRAGALPVAEVLGGRVSKDVEARARAFAAELLLPARAAAAEVSETADIEVAVAQLSTRFRVSRALTAWQIRNSGVPLAAAERAYLKSLVSAPSHF